MSKHKAEAFESCLGHNRAYDRLIDSGASVELLDKAIHYGFECGESFTSMRMLQLSDEELRQRRANLGIRQMPSFKLEPSGTIE